MWGFSARAALTLAPLTLALVAVTGPLRAAECKVGIMADMPVTLEEGRRASVPVTINGHKTRFWLDSGAFFSIMPKAKAIELELTTKPVPAVGFYITGIGGKQQVDYTTIKSFGLVDSALTNVDFLVGATDVGNGLIGANIIGMRDTEFDLAHGSVKLINVTGCSDKALAYWVKPGQTYFGVEMDRQPAFGPRDTSFRLPVLINGVRISAELDTGAPTSLISSRAAARAHIDLNGPDVKPVSGMGGFGRHFEKGWTAPVASVSIGQESVLNTHVDVIDGPITASPNGPDMLLGADFILAHRIFVARSQGHIYFTYAGGPPFLAVPPSRRNDKAEPMALPPGSVRIEAQDDAVEPTTADGFARRAAYRFGRHDNAGALADWTSAIALAPDTAAYYRERGRTHAANGEGALAKADVERALALDPTDSELLLLRAAERMRANDRAGALADVDAAAATIPATSLDRVRAAQLMTELGEGARAVTMLDPIIAAHPTDARLGSLLNARCWARALAGKDLDAAAADCSAAIRRDGQKAAYLDSRGTVWFRKGDMAKALADFDAALKVEPRQPHSLYMRSLVHARQGDAAAAKADRDAAIAIRPAIAERIEAQGLAE